jgi:hypothetical protein
MSLAQALEQDRKEILKFLDEQKASKSSYAETGTSPTSTGRSKSDSSSSPAAGRFGPITSNGVSKAPVASGGRRASLSSPLASSSPWTNTLLSEWDDGLYETDTEEPEQERRSSDSVTAFPRKRRQRALKDQDIDIDAGYLFTMQGSGTHIASARHTTTGKVHYICRGVIEFSDS